MTNSSLSTESKHNTQGAMCRTNNGDAIIHRSLTRNKSGGQFKLQSTREILKQSGFDVRNQKRSIAYPMDYNFTDS